MIFKKLCIDYIELNKPLFWTYIIISSITYIIKVVITSIIYSKLLDLKETHFLSIIKQICILWMIQAIFYITKTTIENKLFPEFLSYTRQQLFNLFLQKNKTDFNDANISSDITRILEVTRYMKDVFAWVCQYIIPVSILTIFINLYFVYKMPLLGAVNFISNTTVITYILYSYQKLIDNSNKRETKYMEMVTTLDENFNNLLNIYLNNQVDETISKNKETEDEYTTIYKAQNDEVLLFINKFKAINYMFTVISMILIYKMHTLDTKEFVNIILIFSFYMTLFENLSEDVPGYIMMIGNIKNAEPFLQGIFTTEPKNVLNEYEGTIHFDNIAFKYNKKYIFEDFSLHINKGEHVGIIGRTGRGKSTLMKLLLGFHTVEKGTIYLDGIDSRTLDVDSIRSHINYINQKTMLFNDTIMNNIKYGNHASDDEVIRLLHKYELTHFDPHMVVEKNGSNISLGTQKIIFLIRGILKKSDVYIFDEPFTSIDPKTRESVLAMIDECTQHKTAIIITHDMDGIDTILDRVVEL